MSRTKHEDCTLPDDAVVWVTMEDDGPAPSTWADFCKANPDDGLLLAVARALNATRFYRGGGGAAPVFTVRWYPVPS